mmetsp:Transcript_25142/g.69343  ORF Transcript_25142/g.69343 Transcript_25142/m.69343 type:complete len:114 (-) Transcript_25142:403-744(-)
MFQVRLLLCFLLLTLAQAKTHYIRGQIVNPASRVVTNGRNSYKARNNNNSNNSNHHRSSNGNGYRSRNKDGANTGQRAFSGMNNNGRDHLQRILEFQAVKKFSGSRPARNNTP